MKRYAAILCAAWAISLSAQTTSDFQDWVTCLGIDSGGRLYAGASLNGNGIFTSTDGGMTWTQTKMRYGVTSLTVAKSGTVVTFTNGYALGRYLFRLTNGGADLDSVALSFTPSCITASPNGALYAATFGDGIYRSVDDGMHWTKVDMGFLYSGWIHPVMAISNAEALFVGTTHGVHRTFDLGAHWYGGWVPNHDSAVVKYIFSSSDGKLYAGAFEGAWVNSYEAFVSTDTAKTWTLASMLRFPLDVMAIDSVGEMFAGNTAGVYRIRANGDTTHLGLADIAVSGMGVRSLLSMWKDTLYAGAWGGVYRTTDGGAHWALLHEGMMPDTVESNYTGSIPFGSYITSGVVDMQNNIIIGTDSAGVLRSVDRGKTWMQSNLTVPSITSVAIDSGGTLWASSLDHGVYSSIDHGAYWELADGTGSYFAEKKWQTLAAFTAHVPRGGTDSTNMLTQYFILVGTDKGLYSYQTNIGVPYWHQPSLETSVSAITVTGGAAFFSTDAGAVYRNTNAWSQWNYRSAIGARAAALVVDNAGSLFAAGPRGVFRSVDGATQWVQKNSGIADTILVSAAVDKSGTLYVGSQINGDIYKSSDHGDSWTKIATLGYPVRCLIMSMDGENMYAAAADRLFKTTIVTTVEPDHFAGIQPEGYSLSQNYPNPFNPTTTIRFAISKPEMTSLVVYDLLGRVAARLVNEKLPAGSYEARFDGANLSSGVYFYRLQTGSFVQVRHMLLTK